MPSFSLLVLDQPGWPDRYRVLGPFLSDRIPTATRPQPDRNPTATRSRLVCERILLNGHSIKIRHKLEAAAAKKNKPATAGGKRKTTETVEDKDKDRDKDKAQRSQAAGAVQGPLSGCLEITNVRNALSDMGYLPGEIDCGSKLIADGKYAVSAAKAVVIQHTVPASKIAIAQTADKYDHKAAKDQPVSMSNYMPKRQSNTYVLWDTRIHLDILIAMVTYYDPTKAQYDAILAVEPDNLVSPPEQTPYESSVLFNTAKSINHVASPVISPSAVLVFCGGHLASPCQMVRMGLGATESQGGKCSVLERGRLCARVSVHEDPDGRFIDLTLKPEIGYQLPEMVEQEITGRYLGTPNCDAAESSLFMRKQPGVRNQLARLFKDPGPTHRAKGMRFPRGKDPAEPPP
ncbi:hypothetical protein PGQ11_001977 [Apiospora arundinis]|uniref:Uncharacterized protein n=1 Tax=Apiospora arundinis TaxID=335852 RepID=A0ABR2JHN0_9PEZI